MQQQIIGVIELFATDGADIAKDTLILEEGVIDSLNVMQIIAELERNLGKPIPVTQVVLDDFASPATVLMALKRIWDDD